MTKTEKSLDWKNIDLAKSLEKEEISETHITSITNDDKGNTNTEPIDI